ncbi:hypothetical protein AWB78_04944 [Caballeronia calidae]|uniref:Uncharacterized protein n=1 Tax=Caballeronia calidae TaxID=1777139 RepID=A0A158DBA3_9BURK|nr:hypothetical protein AWB78_04944 [Caballeronia calidae]
MSIYGHAANQIFKHLPDFRQCFARTVWDNELARAISADFNSLSIILTTAGKQVWILVHMLVDGGPTTTEVVSWVNPLKILLERRKFEHELRTKNIQRVIGALLEKSRTAHALTFVKLSLCRHLEHIEGECFSQRNASSSHYDRWLGTWSRREVVRCNSNLHDGTRAKGFGLPQHRLGQDG